MESVTNTNFYYALNIRVQLGSNVMYTKLDSTLPSGNSGIQELPHDNIPSGLVHKMH